MAKRKDAAALFDVFSHGKNAAKGAKGNAKALRIPGWAQPTKTPTASQTPASPLKQPPGLEPTANVPAQPAMPETFEPVMDGQALPASADDLQAGVTQAPLASIEQGRLRLNLNYISCSVLALGLLLVVLGAYKLGQLSGRRQVAPASGPAQMGGLVGQSSEAGQAPVKDSFDHEKLQALAAQRVAGHKYLYVEQNVPSRDDAVAIQRYLWENGREAIVEEGSRGAYLVVYMRNFTGMDNSEVARDAEMIERLAAEENWKSQTGNKYTFKQTRPPQLYPYRER